MRVLAVTILSLLLLLQSHSAFSDDQEQEPIINVLPFEVSEEGEFAFLNSAMDQMLLARLSRYQDVKIVSAALDDEEIKALQRQLQAGDLDELAARLRGQWLIEPSMYSLKEGIQINISLIPLQGGKAASFAEKIDSQEQIIAAVNSLAEDIYKTVVSFAGEQDEPRAEEPVEDGLAAFTTPHPERDYKKGLYGGTSIVTGDQGGAGFESRGIRRSGSLPMQVESMVVGDLDQDGRNELVISSRSMIRIFTYSDLNFRQVAAYDFSPAMKIHAINIGDHDGSGTPKLYVSADEGRFASSAILSWNGSDSLQSISQALRWYIRPLNLPGRGEILVGQTNSQRSIEEFLSPGVFELSRDTETGRLIRGAKMLLPEGTNLFDFIQADLNGDGATETVVIDENMRMLVYDAALNLIWVSSANYGGSKRYFGPVWQKTDKDELTGLTQAEQDNRRLVFIPGRLDVKDITGDGLPEVVISTNEINVATRYFTNVRSFEGGSVACLGWYGQGLVELWQTSRIDGYVSDYFFDKDSQEVENNSKVLNRLYVAQIPPTSIIDKILAGSDSRLLAYEMVVKKVAENSATP